MTDEPIAEVPPSNPGDPNSFENFKQAGVFPTKTATVETLEIIRARADQLAEKWIEEKKSTRDIAVAYADLENDFMCLQDISRFTAVRYDQVMRILPRPEELEELASSHDLALGETDQWRIGPFESDPENAKRRAQELRMLKSVILRFRDIKTEAREIRT